MSPAPSPADQLFDADPYSAEPDPSDTSMDATSSTPALRNETSMTVDPTARWTLLHGEPAPRGELPTSSAAEGEEDQ